MPFGMGGRFRTGLHFYRFVSGPQNTLLRMGSDMTPGVDEQVNPHGLVVKRINHTGFGEPGVV